jgi:HK97 family phage major capsid protein
LRRSHFELHLTNSSIIHADVQDVWSQHPGEMSIGSGADGGVTVPKIIADQMISRAIARSALANIVRVTSASTSDYRRILNLRGQADAWSSETGSRSDSITPTLREITFPHGELFAVPVLTNWCLQDSLFNMEQFVGDNVRDTFAKSLEAVIVNGSGSDRPKGILTSDPVQRDDGDSPERDQDKIEAVGQDTSTSPVDLANSLIGLYFALKPEYRQQGTWVMSSATLSKVRKLRADGGDGQYLWQAGLGASVDAGDGSLLGRRVVVSELLDAVDVNSPQDGKPILFGDFNVGYELVRIGPLTVIRDQVTTKGKTKLYFAQRFGGRLVDNDAIKVMALV